MTDREESLEKTRMTIASFFQDFPLKKPQRNQTDLNDPVALFQPGHFGRGQLVNLADELSGPRLFRVKVESVSVEIRPFRHVTESRPRRVVR